MARVSTVVDSHTTHVRSLRPSLSWSSYPEFSCNSGRDSLIDPQREASYTNLSDACGIQGTSHGHGSSCNEQQAYRLSNGLYKDPASFSDEHFFAKHDRVRKHRSQNFNEHPKHPFFFHYGNYVMKPLEHMPRSLHEAALSPVGFITSSDSVEQIPRKTSIPYRPATAGQRHSQVRERTQTISSLNNGVRNITHNWKRARAIKKLLVTQKTNETQVITAPAAAEEIQAASKQASASIHRANSLAKVARKLRNIRLQRSRSTYTLSSLTLLPEREPDAFSEPETKDKEFQGYGNERTALLYALNVGRESKDAARWREDQKQKEHKIHLLELLDNEPDSCQKQKDRLRQDILNIGYRQGMTPGNLEKLKHDRNLDADARISANEHDLQCSRSHLQRNLISNGAPAWSLAKMLPGKFRLSEPTGDMANFSETAYAVTDISFVEATGHIQLIGPPNYGGLGTGILWIDRSYHGHPRRRNLPPYVPHAGCICKNYQCYEAVTDAEYKYIGIARTKKEKRWVIHLAKERPTVGRYDTPRKPTSAMGRAQNTSPSTRLLSGSYLYDDTAEPSSSSPKSA